MAASFLLIDLNVLDPKPCPKVSEESRLPIPTAGRPEIDLTQVIRGGKSCDDNLYVARYLGKDTLALGGITQVTKDEAEAAVGQVGMLVLHLHNNC